MRNVTNAPDFVALDDLPEEHQAAFYRFLLGRQVPLVEGRGPCAYITDWLEYLERLPKD